MNPLAALALLYAGGLAFASLFAAFAAVEAGTRRPTMSNSSNERMLAFAVADSIRATTPNFTPPPTRRMRLVLRIVGAVVVLAPFAAVLIATCAGGAR